MNCNCVNGCPQCCPEPVMEQVFNCPGTQQVIKHKHIVKHQHDIINEYDVIHEHEFNTRDVVRERQVVRNNDCTTHVPNYCGDECGCPQSVTPMRSRGFQGRRW